MAVSACESDDFNHTRRGSAHPDVDFPGRHVLFQRLEGTAAGLGHLCPDEHKLSHADGREEEERPPIERVVAVEVDDGFERTNTTILDIVDDTVNHRTYCGRGDFDTATFIRRTIDAGYQGPWGVEIISDEHRRTPVVEGLRIARATALDCFERAAQLG